MWMMSSFEKIDCSQRPSLATKVATIYSTLLKDNARVTCFLVLNVMAPPTKVKTNPDVERQAQHGPDWRGAGRLLGQIFLFQ